MTRLADVLVPANGEGTRATVLRWCKSVGDAVVKDEPLLELETDKVTVEIPAPADGTLIEILKQVNAEVSPDEVLARLSLLGESASSPRATATATAATSSASTPRELQAPAGSGDAHSLLSPAVRRLLREHSIDAAELAGTGLDGRITAHDVERYAAAPKPIADDTR